METWTETEHILLTHSYFTQDLMSKIQITRISYKLWILQTETNILNKRGSKQTFNYLFLTTYMFLFLFVCFCGVSLRIFNIPSFLPNRSYQNWFSVLLSSRESNQWSLNTRSTTQSLMINLIPVPRLWVRMVPKLLFHNILHNSLSYFFFPKL